MLIVFSWVCSLDMWIFVRFIPYKHTDHSLPFTRMHNFTSNAHTRTHTLPDDHVFMEDADKRREYIQNGNGKIFVGQYKNMSVFNWEYVQVGGWAGGLVGG